MPDDNRGRPPSKDPLMMTRVVSVYINKRNQANVRLPDTWVRFMNLPDGYIKLEFRPQEKQVLLSVPTQEDIDKHAKYKMLKTRKFELSEKD